MKEGLCFTTNEGCEVIVTKVMKYEKAEILFTETHNSAIVKFQNLISGAVKNPLHKSVLGVGFIGIGPHKVSVNKVNTREYKHWFQMLRRCYSEDYQQYRDYGGIGIYVEPQWHNFQEFAEWCQWQREFYSDITWHLDKDILDDGKLKRYSPETCCFVPREINTLFRNKTPKGYNKRNQVFLNSKFIKTCSSPEEATKLYGQVKTDHLINLSESLKDSMSDRLFDYLMNYEGFLK